MLNPPLPKILQDATENARVTTLLASIAGHAGETARGSALHERACAGWSDAAWADAAPSTLQHGAASFLRVGRFCGTYSAYSKEVTEGLRTVPALCPLVGHSNIALLSLGSGLREADESLVSVACRAITAVAPGRLRFTMVDGQGLGSSFADCLEFDERITGPMVWHAENDIAAALTELVAHMSMVVQKYLKNEYATIDEYNAKAGEVTEPYRLLVVSKFPHKFDSRAMSLFRLVLENGPRVGVHAVFSVDLDAQFPHDFKMADLSRLCEVYHDAGLPRGIALRYDAQRQSNAWRKDVPSAQAAVRRGLARPFVWANGDHEIWVELDGPPPRDLVKRIAVEMKDGVAAGMRVDVSFATLYRDRAVWSCTSADGIAVPLGRQGTKEQLLEFGLAGTAHHALIGGRTGSGKTVLLHTLVCGLARLYAPDELELWLVDFKEGVEFQEYETLPHVRALALETEREFGQSVLQGLVAVMDSRGNLFAKSGVTNIAGYRAKTGAKLPRVVLVMDEFQVLFADDADAISQRSRELLDDLVSRGRGFGLHVVLASQTISGKELSSRADAQIGVRIALQMSEDDSRKILGERNDEAKYLKRAGQAIYNNANGLREHNQEFQAANLSAADRAGVVHEVAERSWRRSQPPVVFEGGRPPRVDPEEFAMFGAVTSSRALKSLRVAFGEPAQVGVSTHAWTLAREARANILVAGGGAAGFWLSCVLAAQLARQVRGAAGELHLVSFLRSDDDLLEALDDTVGQVATARADGRSVERTVAAVAQQLDARRIADGSGQRASAPPIVMVLVGLHRWKALEREGYSESPLSTQLLRLVSDGPDYGIHFLVQVDALLSLDRFFSAGAFARQFGCKVAMSAEDARQVADGRVSLREGWGYVRTVDPDQIQKVNCYGRAALAATLKGGV